MCARSGGNRFLEHAGFELFQFCFSIWKFLVSNSELLVCIIYISGIHGCLKFWGIVERTY